MDEQIAVKIGDAVVFINATGQEFFALVTEVWDGGDPSKIPNPSLNVVYISDDYAARDQYGRQVARSTSVVHQSNQAAHGMKWRRIGEDPS